MLWNLQIKLDAQDAWVDLVNSSLGSAAVIDFFDGTLPGACEDPDDGTLIGELFFNNPPFQDPVAGISDANSIADETVVAAGTILYFRFKASGGTVVCQGTCSDTGGTDFVFDENTFGLGEEIHVDSLQLAIGVGP